MTPAEKLIKIAENEQKVYDAGVEAGKAQGGGDSWYDTFWDAFQQNGNRLNYNNAFSSGNANPTSIGWTNVNFKPKYSMVNIIGYSLFDFSKIEGSLTEILNDLGITLTFNGFQSSGFQGTQFTEIDYINNGMSTMARVFVNSTKLKTLKISTVKETSTFQNAFEGCTALENLTIEGVIGKDGFDVHGSILLTAESYHSIITHCSKTATFTLTLPAEATVRSVYDAKYGEGAWGTITAEYPNLTILYS